MSSAQSTKEEVPVGLERELSSNESTDNTSTIASDLEVDLEISALSCDENVVDDPEQLKAIDKVSLSKEKERQLCESNRSNFQGWEEKRGLDCEATEDEVVRGYGIILHQKDLWTLKDRGWLNNQVSVNTNVNLNYLLNM